MAVRDALSKIKRYFAWGQDSIQRYFAGGQDSSQRYFAGGQDSIQRYFAGGQDSISILIAGKMTTGKSSLVNGILGKPVAKEGNKPFTETAEIVGYKTTVEIPGTVPQKQIQVVVWDTPGLGDPFGDDEAIAKEIAEKCKETDLLVYCLDIRGRLTKDDATGIDLLSTILQPQMWKNAIFALTFANMVPDQATLTERIQVWEDAIKRLMKKNLKIPHDIADDISTVPTGYHRQQPPGFEDWFRPFWAASFIKTKQKCYHCELLNQLQSTECKRCSLPKTYTDSMGSAVSGGEEAAKKLFDEAVEKGYVESRAIVLLLIGAAGAGKSHFKHLILRLPPPAVRESTPLAEAAIRAVSICRATIGDGNMEWQLVSSLESLHMVADAIKAGVPVHLPLANFPNAVNFDPISTKQPDGSLFQPSSNTQCSVPSIEMAPINIPPLDTSPTSPRSGSSTLESPDLSEPSQLTLEKELLDLISQSSGSKKLLDVDWVYIVDSGGQPQFHELLPAFIRYASACVFVTRLDESLTDHPTIEYYGRGGQRHGTPYRSLLTHEQIMKHCFQALQSRRCTSSSPQSGPMVFVAGTHKDQEHHCPETRISKNKKLLQSLRPVFGDKLGLYRLAEPDELIFPVNAKTPSRDDENVACEFRKMVTTSCLYEREKIPIPWFVLEQLIHQYTTERGVRIVSTKECRQIARRLHMGDEAFRAALDYLVALNQFHFYPTILPNVLFCDTQVLPDKMSELVEYSHMLRGSSGSPSSISRMQSHSGGWLRFRDEGIITVEFLQQFPKHYVAGVFTPSDLLKLLSALLITAHLAGSEYFMPSLLYELQPDELDHYRCGVTSFPSPLLVHYPGGWLPSGIFTSLIAYLQNVSNWELLLKSGKPACLHRNCVKFRHSGVRPGSITLIDSFTHIEVHLVTPKPVSPSLCSEIHRAIFEGLKQATDTLSYTNLHPKEAFFCSARGEDCEPTPHLAVVEADGWWSCSINPEVGGELTEGQMLWFSSAEDRAQEKERECAEKRKSPKSAQKPHPQPANSTEKFPSSADKPKLYQLQCLQYQGRKVKIIETVAARWEEVALALHFEGHTIQNIQYDPHIRCIDSACRVMLQKWLGGEGHQPVTWETLMDALVGTGFVAVVEDLQEILRN